MIRLGNCQIKVVFTDIDGVWTDGGMFYGENGEALKKFNTSDSAGVLFLRKLRIPLVVLTGEDSPSVKKRMEKLNIKDVHYGVQDKLKIAREYCRLHHLNLSTETAFIGNDINDWALLKKAGHSAVPADAPNYIKNQATLVLTKKGGEGVFREYIEHLINQNMSLVDFIEKEFMPPT